MDDTSQNMFTEGLSLYTQVLKFPLSYKVTQYNELNMKGMILNVTKTEFDFNIVSFNKTDEGAIIHIKLGSHRLLEYKGVFKEFIDFMSLFNIPFADIQLRLNSKGIPVEVLNQPEILTRWVNLREGELKTYLTDNSVKPIIEGADKDFSDSLQAIKDSLFYQFLLPPVYGECSHKPIHKVIVQSQLYQSEKFPVAIEENFISSTPQEVEIIQAGKFNIDWGKLETLYDKQYKVICNDAKFDYNVLYQAKYRYLTRYGVMRDCIAEFLEDTANKSIVSKQTFNIQFIKNN